MFLAREPPREYYNTDSKTPDESGNYNHSVRINYRLGISIRFNSVDIRQTYTPRYQKLRSTSFYVLPIVGCVLRTSFRRVGSPILQDLVDCHFKLLVGLFVIVGFGMEDD